jgi:pimeloyl-ACP methyl ester carboxylesterase
VQRFQAQAIDLQSVPANVARLRALKVPTLLIWGARDRLIPPALGERFKSDIAGSRLVVLDGLGHVPQEEDPAASVAPVKAFLSAL